MNSQSRAVAVPELEPRSVWSYFAEIANIPRPSNHEERARAYVRGVADRHRLVSKEDKIGNVLIEVPATPGLTQAPITVLQAHLDMVCEKNESKQHDFSTKGIDLVVETEDGSGLQIVRADGTTLGADNGIGVALALAAATSTDVAHGPLELLFTVDEEQGLCGAKALSPDFFRGRRMLNLDSEDEGTLYIGCAGGCDVNLMWEHDAVPLPRGAELVRVRVSGLRGGHSGVEIHEGRGNAIKLLIRTLLRAQNASLQLLELSGGSKRNAIPREAMALIAGPAGVLPSLQRAAAEIAHEASGESYEPDVTIRAEGVSDSVATTGLGAKETAMVLSALAALPSGVIGMHPKAHGLVETSNNVSTVAMSRRDTHAIIEAGLLARSSSATRMRETQDQLAAVGKLAGAKVRCDNSYPGWNPNPDSPSLALCRSVHRQLLGSDPAIAGIHAGLECGIIGERVGGMDMVSLGPTIRGAHSPAERVYVASVERTWRYLVALLATLAQPAAA